MRPGPTGAGAFGKAPGRHAESLLRMIAHLPRRNLCRRHFQLKLKNGARGNAQKLTAPSLNGTAHPEAAIPDGGRFTQGVMSTTNALMRGK